MKTITDENIELLKQLETRKPTEEEQIQLLGNASEMLQRANKLLDEIGIRIQAAYSRQKDKEAFDKARII